MLKSLSGKSEKKRITIYSGKKSATAFREENGKISVTYQENIDYVLFSKKECIVLILIVTIFLAIKSVINFFIRTGKLPVFLYLYLMLLYTIIMIIAIIKLRKDGGKELLRNHGAEHMTILAFKKLGRPPTIGEARKFSRIAKKCGASLYSGLITGQIIGFIIYKIRNFMIPEIVLLIVPLILHRCFLFNLIGMFVQFFTTGIPENRDLRLAIEAIRVLYEKDEEEQHHQIVFSENDIKEFYKTLGNDINEFYKDKK